MNSFTVDSAGPTAFNLGGSNIISKPGLSLIEINGAKVGPPGHAQVQGDVVLHGYGNQSLFYTYSISNGVLLIDITIQNATDSPLCNPVFQLPFLNIPTPTTTNDGWVGEAYIRNPNNDAMSPGFEKPTHAFYTFNSTLGSSIHVKSHFRSETVVDCNQLYVNYTIPPRGSVTIEIVWNVVEAPTLANLFGPYLADYDSIIGKTTIPADGRPVFQAYVSTDPALVSPTNPSGYQMMQLDTPAGIAAAIAMLAPAVGKAQGVFIVDPQGIQSRGQQVRSEWLDTLPPGTLANLPTLFNWGKQNNFGVGIGVRPGAVIVPQNFSTDQSWLLSPDQFPYVGTRIKNALAMGMTGPIYEDSIAFNLADAGVVSYVADQLGPSVKTYTEAWNALSIAKAGIRVETAGDASAWSGYWPTDIALARMLQPNLNVVSLGIGVDPAAHIASCKSLGYSALFDAWMAPQIAGLL